MWTYLYIHLGPPSCTIGVPRPLTTEEENRVKKRYIISIRYLTLKSKFIYKTEL